MSIVVFLVILLSGYVINNMSDEDKVRYFIVIGVLMLILILPKLITGRL